MRLDTSLPAMKVIGLTGGIGSGKSTISRFLAELGAVVIDTDKVGHQVFKPSTTAWREMVDAFGRQILKPDDEIDRNKLSKLAFSSSESLAKLNHIMHPRIYDAVKAQLDVYRRERVRVVVIEAPLLVEAGWTPLVDEVWVTVAPESTVLKRIKGRSRVSEAEILARIRSQISSEERTRHAKVVINTDCSLDELRAKVKKRWDSLTLRCTD